MNDNHEQPGTGDNDRPGQARDGHGRFLPSLDAMERARRAVQLRSRGMSLDQIASELGYTHASAASKAISRALAAVPAADVLELRAMQNAQLDYLTAQAVAILERRHPVVSASGQIVKDPVTGEPLVDQVPRVRAIETLLKIMDRRAKLNGLDAPTKQELTLEFLNSRIKELSTELGRPIELPDGDWWGEDGADE